MKATVIALDLETSRNNLPSVEFYRPDFQVDSVAIAWREKGELKTFYCEGEAKIRKLLERIESLEIPVTVHNSQFEYAVTKYRFPGYESLYKFDTMRLLQVADNGEGTPQGFSLQAGVARWLPSEYHNHKAPYYALIRERGQVRKGKEGANLHLLTPQELESYNTADAVVTLLLHERLTEYFKEINYDWTIDHELFFSNLPYVAQAEGEGVLVARDKAEQAIREFNDSLARIESKFYGSNADSIAAVEAVLRASKLGRYRTERGRENASLDDCKFNIGSTKHLEMLFCDVMGITPKFWTEKGRPMFKRQFLAQFGESGLMLARRRGLIVELQQMTGILEEAGEDSRWRPRVKLVGTSTGRMAGGNHG